ncbi:hypothetical protein RB195_010233 [Necator americanus]|uniref:Reverse transcriptase domain-containing protein n=1 Tax=Necator americanus TaxID=51031 RepID=A0ABR1CZF9_NECAM
MTVTVCLTYVNGRSSSSLPRLRGIIDATSLSDRFDYVLTRNIPQSDIRKPRAVWGVALTTVQFSALRCGSRRGTEEYLLNRKSNRKGLKSEGSRTNFRQNVSIRVGVRTKKKLSDADSFTNCIQDAARETLPLLLLRKKACRFKLEETTWPKAAVLNWCEERGPEFHSAWIGSSDEKKGFAGCGTANMKFRQSLAEDQEGWAELYPKTAHLGEDSGLKVLDEGQLCEQAGFRKGFSTIDQTHTVSKLTEVSRKYKMPLCLTFIDLKKAFDSVETEAVVEALDNQGVPTQYIKKTNNTRLRARLFNATVFLALTYASEAWAFRKQEENTEGKIRWAGHVMRFNDNRWTRAVSDWVPRDINALQEDRRPDGQTSSRSPSKKSMILFVSHAKEGTTGLLWHAIGTNGRITGTRSTSSKINGSQGDQGERTPKFV